MLLWIGLALIGGVILAIGGALLLTNIMERRQAASVLSGRRAHGHDIDFIEAENSMGFHAPQEAARLLGNAMNYARMGQVALRGGRPGPCGPASRRRHEARCRRRVTIADPLRRHSFAGASTSGGSCSASASSISCARCSPTRRHSSVDRAAGEPAGAGRGGSATSP